MIKKYDFKINATSQNVKNSINATAFNRENAISEK